VKFFNGNAGRGRQITNSVTEQALPIVDGGVTKTYTHLAEISATLSFIDQTLPNILQYLKENKEDAPAEEKLELDLVQVSSYS